MVWVRGKSPRELCHAVFCPENQHPLLQAAKYVTFGALAAMVQTLVFGLLGWSRIFPHFAAQGYPQAQRVRFFIAASLSSFLAANVLAYVTNVKWVFRGGRHRRATEFLLFTALASVGFAAGLGVGVREILNGSGGSWQASLFLVITSAAVNFVTRKFVVFAS